MARSGPQARQQPASETSTDPTPDGSPDSGSTATRELLAARFTGADGKRYTQGDQVTLDAERADQLVKLGVLKGDKAEDAPEPGAETVAPD